MTQNKSKMITAFNAVGAFLISVYRENRKQVFIRYSAALTAATIAVAGSMLSNKLFDTQLLHTHTSDKSSAPRP